MKLLATALELYVFLLMTRIVLSWFPGKDSGPVATVRSSLHTATEPVLGPVRQVVPTVAMLDLSPIVVILAANVTISLLAG